MALCSITLACLPIMCIRSPQPTLEESGKHTVPLQAVGSREEPLNRDESRITSLLIQLRAADGATDLNALVSLITRIRNLGAESPDAVEAVTSSLAERAPLYRNRSRDQISALRGLLFLTLADLGPPRSALPVILAELSHGDEPFVYAAAARAAAALGPDGGAAVAALTRPFGPGFEDDVFSLDDFRQVQPLKRPTSARREALYALRAIGPKARPALGLLRAVRDGQILAASAGGTELRADAAAAIAAIEDPPLAACGVLTEQTVGCSCPAGPTQTFATDWLDPDRRQDPSLGKIEGTDQNGARVGFGAFLGQPVFLTFIYTRCENAQKCPRTVASVAQLQQALGEANLSSRTRLVIASYDPSYDNALRMRHYVEARGLALDSHVTLMQLPVKDLERMCILLEVNVNYNAGLVNGHGLQAILLDKQGRYVRSYHSTSWDNHQVLQDLRKLADE